MRVHTRPVRLTYTDQHLLHGHGIFLDATAKERYDYEKKKEKG